MSEDFISRGPVETDETYYGARKKNQHVNKRKEPTHKDKQPIFGIAERSGRVTTKVVADVKEKTLLPIVEERVLPASLIFTDSYTSYDNVRRMGEGDKHERINHTAGIYVMGSIHTQTIEGFWSLLNLGIGGVCHSVSTSICSHSAMNIPSAITVALEIIRYLARYFLRLLRKRNSLLNERGELILANRLHHVLNLL